MSFQAAAWLAGALGALTGMCAARLTAGAFHGARAWVDAVLSGVAGAFLAILAFAVLSLLEGWAAFFQRSASPVGPLLFTGAMLAGSLGAVWLSRRRSRR